MDNRFKIGTIVEDGALHYKIFDCETGRTTHCSIGKLNATIYEMIENDNIEE